MKWRTLTGAAIALRLAIPVFGYGTTISIAVSYCPATYTSSSTSSSASGSTTASASTAPSIVPGEPIVLAFALNGSSQYLQADGNIITDASQAVNFSVTQSGQLSAGNGYVSTSGDLPFQPFAVSPDSPGTKRTPRIFTQFLINLDKILEWLNDAFVDGRAIFCVSDSNLLVVFNGVTPPGCTVIELGAIPLADLNPPPGSSTTALPQSSSSNVASVSTSISQPPSKSGSTSDTVSTSSPVIVISTNQSPSVSSSPTSSPPTPGTSTTGTGSALDSVPPSSSSSSSPSASGTDYPAPTTTGTPNCFDRSPFDGTVNDDFLVLCDTDLQGYELEAVAASNIADCIDACRAYVPTSEVTCVAVEFDIVADVSPCHLKYAIATVNRGGNSFAQAAIIVNVPYAPDIVFSDPGDESSSSSSIVESSTTVGPAPPASTMSTTANSADFPTTSPSLQPVNPTTFTSAVPGSPSIQQSTPSSGSAVAQSSPPASSSLVAVMTSSRAISSPPFAVSSIQQQPSTLATSRNTGVSSPGPNPVSSSPTANPVSSSPIVNPISSSFGNPASSSPTVNSASSSPIVNPASSSPVVNPPSSSPTGNPGISSSTVRNPASSSSVGNPIISSSPVANPISSSPVASTSPSAVTSPASSPSPSLVTSPASTPGPTSRPVSSSPIVTIQATSGSSTLLVSTLTTTSSRTTAALVSTAAAPYCTATPIDPNANFCPTYNHQGLNVNSDGYCYEIECSTSLQGTVLAGGSYVEVSSLRTCISLCTNYNVALLYGCLGVNYLLSSGANANCLLMSTVTGTSANLTANSGRLLYAGYPSITDPVYPLLSSTTAQVVASSITTPVVPASPVTTSMTTTTSSAALSCPTAPTNASAICPGASPVCYEYDYLGNSANYEIECSTQFTGSSTQPLLTFDLNDCINQCQYANVLRANSCLGVTFVVTPIGQGTTNNCYPYSAITCGTRGNATFNSARMLYAGYPQITDYSPSFSC